MADTGIGIDPADLPRVFERFYRVESQRSVAGTGPGLSIAQELVELHGGHIAAVPSAGDGSRFAVCLPLLGGEGERSE